MTGTLYALRFTLDAWPDWGTTPTNCRWGWFSVLCPA